MTPSDRIASLLRDRDTGHSLAHRCMDPKPQAVRLPSGRLAWWGRCACGRDYFIDHNGDPTPELDGVRAADLERRLSA